MPSFSSIEPVAPVPSLTQLPGLATLMSLRNCDRVPELDCGRNGSMVAFLPPKAFQLRALAAQV